MHRKPTYRVYVEEGRAKAVAHVAELPGCFAFGSNASKAVAATSRAINDYLVWLRRHREPLVPEAHVSRPNLADIAVMEVRTEGAPLQGGIKAAIFPFDTVAWDDEKLERTLRWLGYSRADLLAAIEGLSDDEIKGRRIAPDRTLWDTLLHIANAEYGYINRIVGPLVEGADVTDGEPAAIRDRLFTVRQIVERWSRSVPYEKRAQIIYPTWTRRPDEPWTLQKALRRALEHEREHLLELR